MCWLSARLTGLYRSGIWNESFISSMCVVSLMFLDEFWHLSLFHAKVLFFFYYSKLVFLCVYVCMRLGLFSIPLFPKLFAP